MPFDALPSAKFPRRALLVMPLALGGLAAAFYPRERSLPDAAAEGNGAEVEVSVFAPNGKLQAVRRLRKVVRSDGDWRHELTASEFAITRRQGTEFAFANRYWKSHDAGMYRCVCCGTALFRSQDKFDSDTGWPSFFRPCAQGNVYTKVDSRVAEERNEVLCQKCDAHLGHVFTDGPAPTGLRYCLNSAALRLVRYS